MIGPDLGDQECAAALAGDHTADQSLGATVTVYLRGVESLAGDQPRAVVPLLAVGLGVGPCFRPSSSRISKSFVVQWVWKTAPNVVNAISG
jgi:hypothetical protein